MRQPAEARLAYQVELVHAKRVAAGIPLDDTWSDRLRARWPHRLTCEMSCGPGWSDLIEAVNELVDLEGVDPIEFRQIKEKFGSARLYWHGEDPVGRIDALMDAAEEISESMCETCGRHSKMRDRGGYIHSACDDHALSGSTIVRVKTEQIKTTIGRFRATKIAKEDE